MVRRLASGGPFAVAIGVSALIFAVFVAYAFLSRSMYRTTAIVALEPSADGTTPNLPVPLEAARRLHEAVLDAALLTQLSKEMPEPSGSDAGLSAASEIREAFQVDTFDSRVFSISFRDSEPARAQRICNVLAKKAVERAPIALAPVSADAALQERDRKLADALAFLNVHPEVGATDQPKDDKDDSALYTLRNERARLSALLTDASAPHSDNPYGDPAAATLTPERIQRRIQEIDGVMAARKKALEHPGPRPVASAGLESEWRDKLQALRAPTAPSEPASKVMLHARLMSEAALPTAPVEPNRKLVLLIGLLVALGVGGVVVIVKPGGRRSRHSSRTRSATAPLSTVPRTQPSPVPPPEPPVAPPFPPRTQQRSDGLDQTLALPPAVQAMAAAPGGPPLLIGDSTLASAQPRPPLQSAPALGLPALPPAEALTSGSILPRQVIEINAASQFTSDSLTLPDEARRQRLGSIPDEPRPRMGSITDEPRPRLGSIADEPRPRLGSNPDEPRARMGSSPDEARPRPARGPSRVTQVLGSPIDVNQLTRDDGVAPRAPEPPPLADPPARPRAPAFGQGGTLSMAAQNTLVIAGQGERGRRGSDPAPSPLAAYDISAGWRPEPTLVPAARRDLRDDLLPLSRGRGFVVAVAGPTSAHDQKSRVAAELALALSERGACRVLVVEGDFQRPALHKNLRAVPNFSSGFSQQIHARTRSTDPPGWLVTRCSPSLDVLAEGAVRSPGLMVSKQFEDCFGELRAHYDFIIVDGPPLSADTECRVLDSVADGVLLVAKRVDDPGLQASVFSTKSWSKLVTTA